MIGIELQQRYFVLQHGDVLVRLVAQDLPQRSGQSNIADDHFVRFRRRRAVGCTRHVGQQRQLSARFDANPGVPTTVTWRVSDANLAQIDASGLITAKCSLAGGTETVTAIATADTTVRGSARFGVQAQTACS